jgi:predicted dehydrogenase
MSLSNPNTIGTSRRSFLKSTVSAAAAAGLMAAPAVHAAGSETLKIGLVGCGGRGTGAAGQALAADSNAVLTAMGDAFDDRLKSSLETLKKQSPDKVKVEADHCFTGVDAYQKVIDSGVDVVLLTSPPGFRPMHIEYAVKAGKHIFAEKPMAVDGPGVRSVMKSVEEAKRKNLALVAGFNSRYTPAVKELYERIHDGAIGEVAAMYGTFNTGYLWLHPRQPEWSDMEWQIRNWYYFTWLSGDHLVEQAVHNVDKMAWAMKDQMPARAVAFGGRQVRVEPQWGHIFDHFSVVYEWETGARGFLFCRQQEQCANDVSDYVMGGKGTAALARGAHAITGEHPWKYDGPVVSGHQAEHNDFFAGLRTGKHINDGERMVRSTLMSIMGRMAAYTGQVITWEQAMNSQEDTMPKSLAWGPIATPPVAMPGKTKFI